MSMELNSLDFSELEVKTPEMELPEATEICGSSMSISENPNFSGKEKLWNDKGHLWSVLINTKNSAIKTINWTVVDYSLFKIIKIKY